MTKTRRVPHNPKLSLAKETVRALDAHQLRNIAGGSRNGEDIIFGSTSTSSERR